MKKLMIALSAKLLIKNLTVKSYHTGIIDCNGRLVLSKLSAYMICVMLLMSSCYLSATDIYVQGGFSGTQSGTFSNPFTTIDSAVDLALANSQTHNTIFIRARVDAPNTYYEKMVVDMRGTDCQNLTISNYQNENVAVKNTLFNPTGSVITLIGEYGSVIAVEGISISRSGTGTYDSAISIISNYTDPMTNMLASVTITDCAFSEYKNGVLIMDDQTYPCWGTHIGNLIIQDCSFTDGYASARSVYASFMNTGESGIGSTLIDGNLFQADDEFLAFIKLEDMTYAGPMFTNVNITNNKLINNSIPDNLTPILTGLVLYQLGYDDETMLIEDCYLENCRIVLTDTKTDINRIDSYCMDSIVNGGTGFNLNLETIQNSTQPEITISNSIFYGYKLIKSDFNNIYINQCSFVCRNTIIDSNNDTWVIDNSVLAPYNTTGYQSVIDGTICDVTVNYSCLSDPLDDTNCTPVYNNCIQGNPRIDFTPNYYPDTPEYTLIWDVDGPSPCMDAAYPGANNELTDPDDTPPDMGFKYFHHRHQIYFDDEEPNRTKFWKSFPVVDYLSYDDTNDWYLNEVGVVFESFIPQNGDLKSVYWSYAGSSGEFAYIQWLNSTYRITAPKGFKIEFDAEPTTAMTLDGLISNPATTPVELYSQTFNDSNLIGYFVDYTQDAASAFSMAIPNSQYTYLDYVYSMEAQGWSAYRKNTNFGSDWIINPSKYTLSYGDAVDVHLFTGAPSEMYWNCVSFSSMAYQRPEPEFFSYTEELEYDPIFIELDPEDMPTEIGLFVNDVCYGASVVDSTIVEIPLYFQDSKEGDSEVEIAFYYAGKGKHTQTNWLLYDNVQMKYVKSHLMASEIQDFALISFKSGDSDAVPPIPTQLEQNYPNPFNPLTRISFSLSKDQDIALSIYNVRGEKVRSLLNGNCQMGSHNINWDSTDDNGNPVSSGVYFYRLTTAAKQQTMKMLLMK